MAGVIGGRIRQGTVATLMLAICLVVPAASVSALTPIPIPDPKPGSYGLEATKTQPAPTQGATITVPGNGASFTNSPITVSGICPSGLLVQVYNNGVMAGAVMCENGSFRLEVSLFAGDNELTANVYDDLDQVGPPSNTVRVTYADTNFSAFGQSLTLTSTYGRRAAATNYPLEWPLQLSGGTGPYALSTDWGDATAPELMSQPLASSFITSHTYKRAGIYRVNIKATDVNGVSAFLQVIAVSNGQIDPIVSGGTKKNEASTEKTIILWIPAAVSLGLLFPAYWLGRRSQLVSLRNKMLKERDAYAKKQQS